MEKTDSFLVALGDGGKFIWGNSIGGIAPDIIFDVDASPGR